MSKGSEPAIDEIIRQSAEYSPYALPPSVLRELARILGAMNKPETAETGCGASTLVFSQFSRRHTVFAFDEFDVFARINTSKLRGEADVEFVEGPTQQTLPRRRFTAALDAVLLDGPHAFPFPALEYFHFLPHLRPGGVLVIDDLQIRSVNDLYRFLRSDVMFEVESLISRTAFLRRTDAPTFAGDADGWENQGYHARPLLRFSWWERLCTRISILALARSQDTPPLRRIPRLFALNPAHHLRR